jgi:spore coat protein A, manganese oxidase
VLTRRLLLHRAVSASGAAALHEIEAATPKRDAASVGHLLKPFVDPLPIPAILRPPDTPGEALQVELRPCQVKVHRDLPATTVWGYNGMWPGPTLEVRKGKCATVDWVSKLPLKHLLPVDHTIHGAEASLPEVRCVTHVHGASVMPDSDGYPDAWFTANGEHGPKFKSGPAQYPNDQPAATLWYHDHCMGSTRLNIYAGLAGFYLIRDELEEALNLPSGAFDIPLMIQDRQFQADGRLLYPKAVNGTHPIWIQEFFGDVICVNGKAMPFLEVEPRKYRFRFLNASNARFYHLRLGFDSSEAGDVPKFHQIGSDSGLLPAPVPLNFLLIAPAERFDVVIDFAGCEGKALTLRNDAPAPYTMGGQIVPEQVMLFKVTKPLSGADTSVLAEQLAPFEPFNPASAARERILVVTETERARDGYVVIGLLGKARWHDPITEDPKAGSSEIWSFANTTGDVHPLHLHLVRFQVLNRQTFDVPTYLQTGQLVLTGRPMAPETNESPAWKDTVKAYPGYVTRVMQKFDLPAGVKAEPGREYLYVWHCHILEHEDNEMMRPYKVVG